MARDTVRLDLEGVVSLDHYIDAMKTFQRLLDAVAHGINPNADIRWVVYRLEGGSAHTVVRGVGDDQLVSNVVETTERAAHDIAEGRSYSVPIGVRAEIDQLAAIRNGAVTGISFGSEDAAFRLPNDLDLDLPPLTVARPMLSNDLGDVTGRVEAMFGHERRTSINVYELLNDRRVECIIPVRLQADMDQWWKRLVTVTGLVRRDPDGIPIRVVDVESVVPHEDPVPGAWRRAIGAYDADDGAPPVDELIERARDV